MDRDQAITTIKRHEAELRGLGVRHATVFGSTVRRTETGESDIDVAVALDPESPLGLDRFDQLDSIQDHLAVLLGQSVDVVDEQTRSKRIRRAIEKDGTRAF